MHRQFCLSMMPVETFQIVRIKWPVQVMFMECSENTGHNLSVLAMCM